jgi:polynucleotide 5'-kinase involved in rRNA processing
MAALVVNTHGWVKGLGVPILHEIIRLLSPSVIMHQTSSIEGRNFAPEPPLEGLSKF